MAGKSGERRKASRNGNRPAALTAATADHHLLYEISVQDPTSELDLVERIYRSKRGRGFKDLKEDFCGTATLSCHWVRGGADRRAVGVDLHAPTLAWGLRYHMAPLGEDARRVKLIQANVLDVRSPKVDVVLAMNYSYSVFKTRAELLRYFKNARRSLRRDGMFVIDAFGGTDAMGEIIEERANKTTVRPDGTRVPRFTYVWEQARFNPIDNRILCYIHFKFRDGTTLKRAFTYDWRLWQLPELRELMEEAGFRDIEFYADGWAKDGEADGVYRRKTRFENIAGWLAYVVGYV